MTNQLVGVGMAITKGRRLAGGRARPLYIDSEARGTPMSASEEQHIHKFVDPLSDVEGTHPSLKFVDASGEAHWRGMAFNEDPSKVFGFTNREMRVMFHEIDRLRGNLAELIRAEQMYRANEGIALKRLSNALTGGAAGTWDEIFDAAEKVDPPSLPVLEDRAAMKEQMKEHDDHGAELAVAPPIPDGAETETASDIWFWLEGLFACTQARAVNVYSDDRDEGTYITRSHLEASILRLTLLSETNRRRHDAMSPDERRHAILTLIAAQLEHRRAEKAIKLYCLMSEDVAPSTVARVFAGKDHRITTLVDIADLMDADLEIRIVPR